MVEELTEEEEEQFDNVSFQKMLAKHFPSRYQNEKVKKSEAIEKLKDNVKENKKKTKKKKKKAQEVRKNAQYIL